MRRKVPSPPEADREVDPGQADRAQRSRSCRPPRPGPGAASRSIRTRWPAAWSQPAASLGQLRRGVVGRVGEDGDGGHGCLSLPWRTEAIAASASGSSARPRAGARPTRTRAGRTPRSRPLPRIGDAMAPMMPVPAAPRRRRHLDQGVAPHRRVRDDALGPGTPRPGPPRTGASPGTTRSPPGRTRPPAAGATVRSEMKDRSAVTTSTRTGRRRGAPASTERTLTPLEHDDPRVRRAGGRPAGRGRRRRAITSVAPRWSRQSTNPPVEEPASSARRPCDVDPESVEGGVELLAAAGDETGPGAEHDHRRRPATPSRRALVAGHRRPAPGDRRSPAAACSREADEASPDELGVEAATGRGQARPAESGGLASVSTRSGPVAGATRGILLHLVACCCSWCASRPWRVPGFFSLLGRCRRPWRPSSLLPRSCCSALVVLPTSLAGCRRAPAGRSGHRVEVLGRTGIGCRLGPLRRHVDRSGTARGRPSGRRTPRASRRRGPRAAWTPRRGPCRRAARPCDGRTG